MSRVACFNDLSKRDKLILARLCLCRYPDTNKSVLCAILNVNRSSLYWRQKKQALDIADKNKVIDLLESNPCYGYRRVGMYFKWSYNKSRRIMRTFDIYPRYKKPRIPCKREDMGQAPQPTPNLLKSITTQGKLNRPNYIWSSDFTYLRYKNSFLYLATVIDSYSKDIVGFEVHLRHTEDLVSKALLMATRQVGASQIIHSDQGSEYRSYHYQHLLKQNNIQISMSKKASPWENGYQESFYGKFKYELGNLNQYQTLEQAIEAIYKQIYYYNHQRIHTTIKDIPVHFRRKYFEQHIEQHNVVKSLENSV